MHRWQNLCKIYHFYMTFSCKYEYAQKYVWCKTDTYKSFLQDGDILVVVFLAVDAVDNTSGHILSVQLWGWWLSSVTLWQWEWWEWQDDCVPTNSFYHDLCFFSNNCLNYNDDVFCCWELWSESSWGSNCQTDQNALTLFLIKLKNDNDLLTRQDWMPSSTSSEA